MLHTISCNGHAFSLICIYSPLVAVAFPSPLGVALAGFSPVVLPYGWKPIPPENLKKIDVVGRAVNNNLMRVFFFFFKSVLCRNFVNNTKKVTVTFAQIPVNLKIAQVRAVFNNNTEVYSKRRRRENTYLNHLYLLFKWRKFKSVLIMTVTHMLQHLCRPRLVSAPPLVFGSPFYWRPGAPPVWSVTPAAVTGLQTEISSLLRGIVGCW